MLGKVPLFLGAWLVVALANTLISAGSFAGPRGLVAAGVAVVLLWGVALYRRARIAWYVWLYLSAIVILDALMAEGGPDLATHRVVAASVEIALLLSPQARAWFAEPQPVLTTGAE